MNANMKIAKTEQEALISSASLLSQSISFIFSKETAPKPAFLFKQLDKRLDAAAGIHHSKELRQGLEVSNLLQKL